MMMSSNGNLKILMIINPKKLKDPNNNTTTTNGMNGNSNKTSLPVNHHQHHHHHHNHNHNHQHISRTSQMTSPRNTATTTTTTTLTATIVSNHPTQYKVRAHHRPNVGEEMTVALVTSPSNTTTNTSTTKPPVMPTSPTKTAQTTTTTAASPTIHRSPPNLLFQSASATAVPLTTSAAPNNERQLSYLKLTCLLNGYDDPTVCLQQQPTPQQPSTTTATRTIRLNSTNHNSMRPQKPLTFAPGVQTTVQTNASNGEFLKSSKAMLSTDERYYDIKLKYLRQQQQQNQENTAVRSPTVGALVLNPKKKQSSPPPPIQATKQEPTTTTTTTSFSLKVSVNDVSATNSSIDSIPTSIVTPTTNNNSNQPIDHSLEVLPPERIIAGCKPSNNTITTTIETTEKPAIKEEEKEEPKCKEVEEEEKEKVVVEAIKDEEKKENQVEVISEPTKPEEAEKPKPIEETETAVENKPEENKEEKQNDDQIATTTTTIQDGNYYIKLHDQSCVEINVLCKEYEKYVDENDEQNRVQNEEVQGQIQAAIGKGQLLINQKLKQFKGLCLKNISEKTTEVSELKEGEFVTRDEDLAGFWDLVSIQVDDIRSMFDKLSTLRSTGWKIEAPVKKPAAKKPISNTKADVKPMNGMKQTAASKARAEAAKQRLLEAKKLAAAKQQQPTE